jgi:hypothetical protein
MSFFFHQVSNRFVVFQHEDKLVIQRSIQKKEQKSTISVSSRRRKKKAKQEKHK